MERMKPIVIYFAIIFAMILLIPTFLVLPFTQEKEDVSLSASTGKKTSTLSEPVLEVAVYRSKTKQIDNIPLEEYVKGVVASEMPAEFELEALKAQALTARTYIVKQLLGNHSVGAPDGAVVTDTVMHQVYKSPEELRAEWGAVNFDWKMARISEAVEATKGQIIVYNEEPITASFFSTSNGYTENSEDYWTNSFPYLRSVESPWDRTSPKFTDQVVIPLAEFEKKLGVKVQSDTVGDIVSRTAGQRVAKVQINGKTFAGREIRETLGLNSSDFTWKRQGNNIIITTKGYGHGVGMSQYGANGMATEGKTFQDIIAHYYKGTSITTIDPYIKEVFIAKQ